jgi:amino acid transporter
MGGDPQPVEEVHGLQRHFGLLQATALNVTFVVGLGVFVTIPMMLKEMPGPGVLLAWVAAGVLILADGLIWSELAASIPGSGGSYLYLLEAYGKQRWGRLMAFLFVWQFMLSGPLEIASGLIAIAQVAKEIDPHWARFDKDNSAEEVIGSWGDNQELKVTFGPSRLAIMVIGVGLIVMLYRRITILARLTVMFWVCVLAAIAWILVEGWLRFDPGIAFKGPSEPQAIDLSIGKAMAWAVYAYIGYYSICYMGDEVRDPGRTIPRSIIFTCALVCLLFVGLHLAFLGTVPWQTIPRKQEDIDNYSLAADFMRRIHGEWAVILVSLLLIVSSIGSAFAALLSYSRIPYGAARHGHFFSIFGRVHARHHIPHLALLLVGGLTISLCFFDLGSVITALIVTRVLQQFIGQVIGVMLLRHTQPDRPRPYRIFLYPLPCVAALIGWVFLYYCADVPFMVLGLATLGAGVLVFLIWSWWTARWPFGPTGKLEGERQNAV